MPSPIHSVVMSGSLPQVSRRSFLTASAKAAAGRWRRFAAHRRAAANPGWRGQLLSTRHGLEAQGTPSTTRVAALDSLSSTDLDAFESMEEAPLKALREYAQARACSCRWAPGHLPDLEGVQAKWGTDKSTCARESGGRSGGFPSTARGARHVGRPADGRRSGIERQSSRCAGLPRGTVQAADAGVKIAVENHARRYALHRAGPVVE